MPAIERTPVQIRFADVDMARHVHNAVYFHWFELGRMAFLRRVIPAGNNWSEQGLILARNECDHREPVRLHDVVEVRCWCDRIGTSSFDLRYAVDVRDGERTSVHAEGRSVMVCYDFAAQRSIPIPDAWRSALEQLRTEPA